MADFNAIAQAIAVRFSSSNVTAPSGETNIRSATSALPQAIAVEPTVLVFPPGPDAMEFSYTMGTRTGTVTYPVRFYLWRIRDEARNATLCLKWLNQLYTMLDAQVHLGQEAAGVTYAVVKNMGIGRISYGGADYDGITADVEVHIAEALTPSN